MTDQLPPLRRRWLTVADAAEYMSVDVATINRWVREGRLSRFKLAGPDGEPTRSVRFAVDDLDALVVPMAEVEASTGEVDTPPGTSALLRLVRRFPHKTRIAYQLQAKRDCHDFDFHVVWSALVRRNLIVAFPDARDPSATWIATV